MLKIGDLIMFDMSKGRSTWNTPISKEREGKVWEVTNIIQRQKIWFHVKHNGSTDIEFSSDSNTAKCVIVLKD